MIKERLSIPLRACEVILFLTVTIFFMLLTGCTTHIAKKDGPPNFYVDETRIANAVPKREPLAKYGNMSSYRVFGKRYYVMKSNKYYDEVGTASWYGTMFHNKRTSSGEPYNMLAMTAAHRSLPLPTYVEVTNLKNHRKVIVKVNDRGPFACNRIIDLSYVAAKKLGMIGHGTTKVRVRALDPYNFGKPAMFASRKQIRSTHSTKFVYLQVGAFRSIVNAKRLRQRLSPLFSAPIKIAASKQKLYRVQIGPIKDLLTANKINRQLKGLGIQSNWIYEV